MTQPPIDGTAEARPISAFTDSTPVAADATAPNAIVADTRGPASEHVAYFKVYEEYAKTLRTWLVAYGVGAPVLFVTNKDVAEKLASSHAAPSIAKLFLIGVGLQIFLAMLNKTVMWANYWSELNPEEAAKRRFKFASWVSSQYWIDFSIDLLTVVFFGAATWGAFRVLMVGA